MKELMNDAKPFVHLNAKTFKHLNYTYMKIKSAILFTLVFTSWLYKMHF